MAEEEVRHRTMLIELYQQKFGEYLPLIRRQDVKGFIKRKASLWLRGRWASRRSANTPSTWSSRRSALSQGGGERARRVDAKTADGTRRDRGRPREPRAQARPDHLTDGAREEEDEIARRMFVLQYVQPGLAGLMDGSVSTLAPLFAAAFATHNTWETFLVGMAASVGAGISMGFAEALSDDGTLTGRGRPGCAARDRR